MSTPKNLSNLQIAKLLRSVAAAYEVKGEKENKFRIIAYDRAATEIEHLSTEIKDLWENNKLSSIPGIGGSLTQHLTELFKTGKAKHFNEVLKDLPPAMFDFLEIKGIGAKTAFKLCKELSIYNPKNPFNALEQAAKRGKIAKIEGFGPDSELRILSALKEYKKLGESKKRMLLPYAEALAQRVIDYLSRCDQVKEINPLGSLRRQAATIGDVEIGIASDNPKKVIDFFLKFPEIERVLGSGERDASVFLKSGHQIDLKIQSPKSYGALLQHYTGSKLHNIHLREIAQKKKLSLSEYGIKNLKEKKINEFVNEKDFYKYLGMNWIPPQLRENRGEIEAATKGKIPKLIELKDIKGDLHIHSDFPIEPSHDLGSDPMKNIVKKANELGYEYIAFAEHNPSFSRHKPEEIISILKRKKEYIDKNKLTWKKQFGIHVFNSLEIDIKPDGRLAIPEKGFDYLDFAIASIHTSFHMQKKEMTDRIIKALSHPKVKILGHPTGRKLAEREGYEIDWERMFAFCKENNKILEINSWPDRLDLPPSLIKDAVKQNVKLSINTDSHSLEQLDFMKYGIAMAQRGWATKRDIINTLSLNSLSKLFSL